MHIIVLSPRHNEYRQWISSCPTRRPKDKRHQCSETSTPSPQTAQRQTHRGFPRSFFLSSLPSSPSFFALQVSQSDFHFLRAFPKSMIYQAPLLPSTSKMHPPKPEKTAAPEDTSEPTRYHIIYMCPFFRKYWRTLLLPFPLSSALICKAFHNPPAPVSLRTLSAVSLVSISHRSLLIPALRSALLFLSQAMHMRRVTVIRLARWLAIRVRWLVTRRASFMLRLLKRLKNGFGGGRSLLRNILQ